MEEESLERRARARRFFQVGLDGVVFEAISQVVD